VGDASAAPVGLLVTSMVAPAVGPGVAVLGAEGPEVDSNTSVVDCSPSGEGDASESVTSGLANAPVVRVETTSAVLASGCTGESWARSGSVATSSPCLVCGAPAGASSGEVLVAGLSSGTPARKKPSANKIRARAKPTRERMRESRRRLASPNLVTNRGDKSRNARATEISAPSAVRPIPHNVQVGKPIGPL